MILDAGRRFRLSSPSHLIRFHYQMRENIYVCLDAHIIIPLSPPFLVAYFSGGWNEGSKLETRGRENEGGGGNDLDGRIIMYHFTDDPIGELRSFTQGVDLRGGAWKLTADPALQVAEFTLALSNAIIHEPVGYPGFRDVME